MLDSKHYHTQKLLALLPIDHYWTFVQGLIANKRVICLNQSFKNTPLLLKQAILQKVFWTAIPTLQAWMERGSCRIRILVSFHQNTLSANKGKQLTLITAVRHIPTRGTAALTKTTLSKFPAISVSVFTLRKLGMSRQHWHSHQMSHNGFCSFFALAQRQSALQIF